MKKLRAEDLQHWLKEEYLILSAQASFESIQFLTQQILRLEKAIGEKVKLNKSFQNRVFPV